MRYLLRISLMLTLLCGWMTLTAFDFDGEIGIGAFYDSNYTFTPYHSPDQTDEDGLTLSVDGDITLNPLEWMDITYLFIFDTPTADGRYGFFTQELSYLTTHDFDTVDFSWGGALNHTEIGIVSDNSHLLHPEALLELSHFFGEKYSAWYQLAAGYSFSWGEEADRQKGVQLSLMTIQSVYFNHLFSLDVIAQEELSLFQSSQTEHRHLGVDYFIETHNRQSETTGELIGTMTLQKFEIKLSFEYQFTLFFDSDVWDGTSKQRIDNTFIPEITFSWFIIPSLSLSVHYTFTANLSTFNDYWYENWDYRRHVVGIICSYDY